MSSCRTFRVCINTGTGGATCYCYYWRSPCFTRCAVGLFLVYGVGENVRTRDYLRLVLNDLGDKNRGARHSASTVCGCTCAAVVLIYTHNVWVREIDDQRSHAQDCCWYTCSRISPPVCLCGINSLCCRRGRYITE